MTVTKKLMILELEKKLTEVKGNIEDLYDELSDTEELLRKSEEKHEYDYFRLEAFEILGTLAEYLLSQTVPQEIARKLDRLETLKLILRER